MNDRDALPSRLRDFRWQADKAWCGLTVEGGSLEARHVVAIVGTREADPAMLEGARWIAQRCAERGIVVASGGAYGIDAAAHEGAMACPHGETWVVLGHGCDLVYPPEHEALYERIVESGGRLVWPFKMGTEQQRWMFRYRNGVLVALADAVIMVQCDWPKSGALNTTEHARKQKKPLWAVPPVPWVDNKGARELLRGGARPLYRLDDLFASLEGRDDGYGDLPLFDVSRSSDSSEAEPEPATDEERIVRLLGDRPRHPDELVSASGLSFGSVSRALLTLSLDSVVVVDPDGRYRRCR